MSCRHYNWQLEDYNVGMNNMDTGIVDTDTGNKGKLSKIVTNMERRPDTKRVMLHKPC